MAAKTPNPKKQGNKPDASLVQARAARVAAGAASAPQLTVVQPASAVVAGPMFKMKDIVDKASVKSGVNKKDTRAAVEAAVEAMFEALAAGAEMNLPPMGRMKVVKEKATPNGKVLTVKVRLAAAGNPKAKTPLANDED